MLLLSQLKSWKKSFFYGGVAGCLVWAFMIIQFWWGNHDWKPLQAGVGITDGFFEGRYSQHLFLSLLFDGQLSLLVQIVSLFGLSFLGCLMAIYLGGFKDRVFFFLFLLFVCTQPYTSILFYYHFILLPLIWYAVLGVGILFFAEPPYNLRKFFIGGVGAIFLLGSYPPIISLVATLFVGRKLVNYVYEKASIKEIVISGLFLSAQFLLAGIVASFIWKYLTFKGLMNAEMYNLQIRGWREILPQIFSELIAPIQNIYLFIKTLGVGYAIFYGVVLSGAIIKLFWSARDRWVIFIGICGLLLASRLPFLFAVNASEAEFRIMYWGQLGLLAFSLSVLFNSNVLWLRNFLGLVCVVILFVFIKTDYELQKTQYFMFRAERLYHSRVGNSLLLNQDFKIDKKYIMLSLGYPNFKKHFCWDGCLGYNNDVLSNTVLPADLAPVLFWDDVIAPVRGRFGVWNNKFWTVEVAKGNELKMNDERINHLRWWMYQQATMYPADSSVYLDDNLLVLMLDEVMFYKNRELVCKGLSSL